MAESTDGVYTVEKLTGRRVKNKRVQYLVRWQGYGPPQGGPQAPPSSTSVEPPRARKMFGLFIENDAALRKIAVAPGCNRATASSLSDVLLVKLQ